jgi:streptogramin lyase
MFVRQTPVARYCKGLSRISNFRFRISRVVVVCVICLCWFAYPDVHAQPYTWTTLAGGLGDFDGTNLNAGFFQPYGIAADSTGRLFVADTGNDLIRNVSQAGTNWVVSTLAGSISGFVDGTNSDAQFDFPAGVATDATGNLFVADFYNNAIRKVSPSGTNWVVTTVAGNGSRGTADGTNDVARFYHPTGVALDGAGRIYVADEGNNTVRRIVPSGTNWVVTTLAGLAGSSGTTDGTNTSARFAGPWGIAVDSAGRVYVSDFISSRLRRVVQVGTNWVVTTIAGSGYGAADGTGNLAQFNYPMGLAVDGGGNLYVGDYYNDAIRKVQPMGTNWVVTTIGGAAGVSGNQDGSGTNALFNLPRGIAVNSSGNLFVADTGNHTIRMGQPALVLRINLSGNQIILSCPSSANNFLLETTAAVAGAGTVWSTVTNATISGNDFIVPRNLTTRAAYYRLKQMGQPALVLRIALSGNQIVLSCPSSANNFVLETTAAIAATGTVWSPVTNATVSGNDFIVPRNLAIRGAFFRLRQ